ncbi:hypothetical protein NOM78_01345 [Proteus mirabilis]|uniref:DUF459 domain-containing protein n=1 Tax=Proteus mirabilis TaxID=584 RepID=UPI00217CEF4B|nr:GDSL-type esterase/lipase family protein [Proteus mirabilis]MCS6748170.1 hypothetical protein [Proteus mirabilis]
MNNIFVFLFMLTVPLLGHCKPIFLGDSLTYQLATSYKNIAPVDAQYLVGSGLSNNQKLDWIEYIKTVDIQKYDTVYIVLGTNDFIQTNEISGYMYKASIFIKEIKKKNNNIVWLIPPTLQDSSKNELLQNTRAAIYKASTQEKIKILDMRESLGMRYEKVIDGVQIRTDDGIHITRKGADYIIAQINNSKFIEY